MMGKVISIGKQDFASLREQNSFYICGKMIIFLWIKQSLLKNGGKMEMILHLLHVRGVLEKH